jgi:hypothetical protein
MCCLSALVLKSGMVTHQPTHPPRPPRSSCTNHGGGGCGHSCPALVSQGMLTSVVLFCVRVLVSMMRTVLVHTAAELGTARIAPASDTFHMLLHLLCLCQGAAGVDDEDRTAPPLPSTLLLSWVPRLTSTVAATAPASDSFDMHMKHTYAAAPACFRVLLAWMMRTVPVLPPSTQLLSWVLPVWQSCCWKRVQISTTQVSCHCCSGVSAAVHALGFVACATVTCTLGGGGGDSAHTHTHTLPCYGPGF